MTDAPQSDGAALRWIGTGHGVDFEVAAWDTVTAEVDLAVSMVFCREVDGAALTGGLDRLNKALNGALMALRKDGIFHGYEGETLLLTSPPSPIKAASLLLLGAGDPGPWSPDRARRMANHAMREVLRARAASAALAPGILDSGFNRDATIGTGRALMQGALEVLMAADQPNPPAKLRRWVFDSGASHVDDVFEEFRAAFGEKI